MGDSTFHTNLFKTLPTPCVVILADFSRFTLLEANDAFFTLLGTSGAGLIGEGLEDVLEGTPIETMIAWEATFQHVVESKKSHMVPVCKTVDPHSLEVRYYSVECAPYFSNQNELEYITVCITEYSDVQISGIKETVVTGNLLKNHQTLIETEKIANIGSWEADLVNKTLLWSDMAKEIHEVTSSFHPSWDTPFRFFKEGEDRTKLKEAILQTIEEGGGYDLELQLITAKGNLKWVRSTGRAEIKEGRCVRIYGVIQDITKDKNIEHDLKESRNQLQSLVQSVEGVVWEADLPNDKITFVSDKFENILGFSPDNWMNDPGYLKEKIHPEDRDEAVSFYDALRQKSKRNSFEFRIIKDDGSVVWINSVIAFIEENGETKWARGLMMDVTTNKRNSQLEHLEKTILEQNAHKDAPTQHILNTYLKGIEALFPKMVCSLYRVKNKHLYSWVAPSLEKSLIEKMGPIAIEENSVACGAATFRKAPVIISDMANHSSSSYYRNLALNHGLLACWSFPILDSEGNVMASLCVFYKEAIKPKEEISKIIERSIALLKIILENRQALKQIQDTAIQLKQGQELAKLGNWSWDSVNDEIKLSDSLYAIYGLEESSFIPTFENYVNLAHPDDRELVEIKINQALKTKGDIEFEHKIIRSDGETRKLKVWCKTVLDENEEFVGMMGATLDITEIKNIQKRLIKSQLLLRGLVKELKISNERFSVANKATGDAIYDWDIVNGRLHWGDGFYRLFGYKKPRYPLNMENVTFSSELSSESSGVASLIHRSEIDLIWTKLNQFVNDPTQTRYTHQYRFLKGDQSYADVEENGYAIRDKEGKAIRMIGALKDITLLKSDERKMKALHQELEQNLRMLALSNAELEKFAHTISHDLQEPLRMVTGFMTQLDKKYGPLLDEKGKQYVHYAVDGAKRMRQIILDLLSFSTASELDKEKEEVDLNELINETLVVYRRKINEKQATFDIEKMPIIYSVKSTIRIVLQNLISNGLVYQPPGNSPHLKISSKETEKYWQFSIEDNGIGIEQAYLDEVFIIFHRLPLHEKLSGTGMGLAVSKKIVERLGGKIWLESEKGVGSKFHFTIAKTLR